MILLFPSPHCAFRKHANSKVQKAPSQLRFSLPSIIITITSNEPWNTNTQNELAWNSSDCFESFSPLNNVVTEGVITPRSNRMKFRLKMDRNPPITNHKPRPVEPVKVKFCFLRGPLRWFMAAKKCNRQLVFELQNSHICEKRSKVR